MSSIRVILLAGVVSLASFAGQAKAQLVINFFNDGNNMKMTTSGSFNTNNFGVNASWATFTDHKINPSAAAILFTTGAGDSSPNYLLDYTYSGPGPTGGTYGAFGSGGGNGCRCIFRG